MFTRRRRHHTKTRGAGLFFKTVPKVPEVPKSPFLFNKATIEKFTRATNTDIQLICNYDMISIMKKGDFKTQCESCCSVPGEPDVDKNYKLNSIVDAFATNQPDTEILSALDSSGRVVGFIICELGRCKPLNDLWVIRLICVNQEKKNKQTSLLLLGAMMYSIKEKYKEKENTGKFILLELLRGYENINGFISYSKMGFIKNVTITCGYPKSNAVLLPMYVSLEHLTQQDIVDLVIKNKEIELTKKQDNTGLYEKYKYNVRHVKNILSEWNKYYQSEVKEGDNILYTQVYTLLPIKTY